MNGDSVAPRYGRASNFKMEVSISQKQHTQLIELARISQTSINNYLNELVESALMDKQESRGQLNSYQIEDVEAALTASQLSGEVDI